MTDKTGPWQIKHNTNRQNRTLTDKTEHQQIKQNLDR